MRGHPIGRPDPGHLFPDGGRDPGRPGAKRHGRAGPEIPASLAYDFIPVTDPARPDVDQNLVRPQRSRFGQLKELDLVAELAAACCSHGSLPGLPPLAATGRCPDKRTARTLVSRRVAGPADNRSVRLRSAL